MPGEATHGFTHFELRMTLLRAETEAEAPPGHAWMDRAAARAAMPTVMRRLLALLDSAALAEEDGTTRLH